MFLLTAVVLVLVLLEAKSDPLLRNSLVLVELSFLSIFASMLYSFVVSCLLLDKPPLETAFVDVVALVLVPFICA